MGQCFRNRKRHLLGTYLQIERLESRSLLAAAPFVPNEILVKFKDGVAEADIANVRAQVQTSNFEHINTDAMRAARYGNLELLRGPADVLATVAKLQSNPLVAYAEPNWVYSHQAVSNDPYYTNGSLWGMYGDATSPANQYGSQAGEAWAANYTGSSTVYVGIIDEGIQFTHPDLAANVWNNPYDTADGIDNDGNGYIDDVHGWDFVGGDNTIYDSTNDDHGTHVTGTIGAKGGNGIGVAGVNWDVQYISGKFLGNNGGTTANAIKALDYMTNLKVNRGLNIVATNNSWGGGGFSQGLLDAITRGANANILFIAAAGNSGSNNDTTANYPANYNTTTGAGYDAVIAVAAINSSGNKSSFSSYGTTTVDLGAPGEGIYSTLPNNTYGSYNGTSMATPHVTGAAALYASAHPGVSAKDIKTAILNSSAPTPSLSGKTATGGRLDVGALMSTTGPTAALSISEVTQSEGNGGTTVFTFLVSLQNASIWPVTVQYATQNGSADSFDYTALPTSLLTFNNSGEISKEVNVYVIGDTKRETNETFFVNLSNASGAIITDSQGIGTILNDDLAALYVYDIRFESKRAGKDWRGVFEIRSDSDGNGIGSANDAPAGGVSVTVTFDGNTFLGVTDSSGIFRTNWINNLSRGNHYAEAIDLALAGYFWDKSLDLEDDFDNDGLPDKLLVI